MFHVPFNIEYVGVRLAELFGVTGSRYQYVLDAYERYQRDMENEAADEALARQQANMELGVALSKPVDGSSGETQKPPAQYHPALAPPKVPIMPPVQPVPAMSQPQQQSSNTTAASSYQPPAAYDLHTVPLNQTPANPFASRPPFNSVVAAAPPAATASQSKQQQQVLAPGSFNPEAVYTA